MPFTPSHIAAAIPFLRSARTRRLLDPWALGVGTMVPDLPMFLPYLEDYSRWHSPVGVVTDDVAAVFVLMALFQFVVRDPLTALLPGPIAARIAALPGPGWRRFPTIALGAAVGAATHVFWDSFTHSWGAEFWGWEWMVAPLFGWLTGYRLLQYASSVAGLAAVGWWLARALRPAGLRALPGGAKAQPPSPGPESPLPGLEPPPACPVLPAALRWGVLGGTGVGACVAAGVWTFVDPPNPVFGWAGVITKTGVGLVVGWGAVFTIYVLLWQVQRVVRLSRA